MSQKQHPDYHYEMKRLEYTKAFIEDTLQATGENKEKFKANIKQSMSGLDFLDSSQSYINILTNTKFLAMAERDLERLKRIIPKPYFARIDLKTNFTPKPEKLYIGKMPLYRKEDEMPIIVDWRSPVANVYYEGRLGDVAYEADSETVNGELLLKRQYLITEGELEEIRDIDLTTTDELLQTSLAGNADNRLKDIVSTIQAEQNRVIRSEMYKPLIVQGVAGSGKTTIALHRIAYFIYTYANNFNPENFMILAPNRLFLNYISEILPELGVEQVQQKTWVEFIQELIEKKFKLSNPNEKLIKFVQKQDAAREIELLKWEASFKGSLAFKDILDRYFEELIQQFIPEQDLKIGKRIIYSAENIKGLIINNYAYLPLYKRVESVKKILTGYLKSKKKELIEEKTEKYDRLIEHAITTIKNAEKRKNKVTELMEKKQNILAYIEEKAKTLIKEYMDKFPKGDLFTYYKDIVTNENNLLRLSNHILSKEQVKFLVTNSTKMLNQKLFEVEDTAALIYLQYKIFGFKKPPKVRNVVIDEAQDFSPFQFYALKSILNTNLITILGDLSQGIHGYRGINDWQYVINNVFQGIETSYITLEQSYRTTVEIMNLANQIIQQSQATNVLLAKPVVRHGNKPVMNKFNGEDGYVESVIGEIKKLKKADFKSIAIIAKTLTECKKIEKAIKQKIGFPIKLLTGEEEYNMNDIVVVPSYISKGLEFDAVFIVTIDNEYLIEDLDIKLLYVAMTRPLHRLYIYYHGKKYPLLQNIDPTFYSEVNLK